jgi:signal peptidase I
MIKHYQAVSGLLVKASKLGLLANGCTLRGNDGDGTERRQQCRGNLDMILWSLASGFPVATALLVLVALRRSFLVVTVIGTSMTPALLPGDRVLVRRATGDELQVGGVVVFRDPLAECQARSDGPVVRNWCMIKRVAAMRGDPVPEAARCAVGDTTVVPPGMLVVLGDSAGSTDSRTWGFLPAGAVLGIAVRRIPRPASSRRGR